MQSAEIYWENDQAISKQFGDIFFSRLGGLEESQHVFLRLNQLEGRFAGSEYFQIGELGFGTGLNFILSWQLFLKVAPPDSRLHFVSTELFPMRAEEIRNAHKLWPEISAFSEELITSLPLAIEGVHRLSFSDGRVTLTLLYGDARETLGKLEVLNSEFDCWFLDGFSPQKNPKMWETELIEIITALTRTGGTLATYSVAGFLRRNLERLGWEIEKVPGFGHKKESLSGKLVSPHQQDVLSGPTPWFSLKGLNHKKTKSAVVIGAGLAGCWSAYCLANKGLKVTLIEREDRAGSAASGNPAALAIPYLSLEKNARQRFYLSAFDYCRRELNRLEKNSANFERKSYGSTHSLPIARIKAFAERFESLSVPMEIARQQSESELFYAEACALNPGLLCHALLSTFPGKIETLFNSEALNLDYKNDAWLIKAKGGKILTSSDVVVIANSYDALTFSQTSWLPLTKVRGEVVLVKDPVPLKRVANALCGNGYFIPVSETESLIGASYNQVFLDPLPSIEIQQKLLDNSRQEFGVFSDQAQIVNSRVAFRASTYDRLPYVGPVPEFSAALEDYREYKKGFPADRFSDCSYLCGLFVNLGHGSRGVVSAPLCSEILASMIVNEALPIEGDLLPSLLPMRWIIREIARGNEVIKQRKAEAEFT